MQVAASRQSSGAQPCPYFFGRLCICASPPPVTPPPGVWVLAPVKETKTNGKNAWKCCTADQYHLVIRNPLALCNIFHISGGSTLQTSLSWERLNAQLAGAGTGGTPRSSNCEQRDSCPTLTG